MTQIGQFRFCFGLCTFIGLKTSVLFYKTHYIDKFARVFLQIQRQFFRSSQSSAVTLKCLRFSYNACANIPNYISEKRLNALYQAESSVFNSLKPLYNERRTREITEHFYHHAHFFLCLIQINGGGFFKIELLFTETSFWKCRSLK